MKKLVLINGALSVALNTLIGLIITVYSPFNFLMADLSIILTASVIYQLAAGKLDNGFKIGLAVLFSITGLVRMICMMVMPQTLENNLLVITAAGILLFELACMAAAAFANKK